MHRLLAAIAALLLLFGAARAETPCGTALVLLVDVSGSVDAEEYALQRDGIARAFMDPAVAKAIWNQPFGKMAVTLVEWSDGQRVVVPWMILDGETSALAFAGMVASVQRSSNGSTALGEAIAFGAALFDSCPCEAARRVIDVSGDGTNNSGSISPDIARDAAVANGITINGLPITGDGSDVGLLEHYEEQVKGGEGAFVIEASGFEDFARAIRQKLVLEIAMSSP